MIYKISYVVIGGSHPGMIVNQDSQPQVGEEVELGGERFEVKRVDEIIPPQDEFAYLHVMLQSLD